MTFILVTTAIMAVSIWLIYKLCQYFDIELKWLSLVLCAIMAFAVNGLAIVFSPFLDQEHYIRLGVLVIVSAALVTMINEYLLRHEQPEETTLAAAGASGAVLPIAAEEAAEPAEEAAVPLQPETPLQPQATVQPEAVTELQAAANTEAGARLSARLVEAMKANKPPAEPAEDEEAADAPNEPSEPEQEPQQEAPAAKQPDLPETLAALSSLDELLDFAYAHKSADIGAAIAAYRAALERYPEDSYAPFLVIELAGLYKENAQYDEAINLYAEALAMPIIANDDAMAQEFNATLRYLGAVQDILEQHQSLATPFSQLGPELLQEIEAKAAKG